MILLSKQLWERLHIVRTAISHALLALDCRLIEPHRRRIVTGAGGESEDAHFQAWRHIAVNEGGRKWFLMIQDISCE